MTICPIALLVGCKNVLHSNTVHLLPYLAIRKKWKKVQVEEPIYTIK